MEVLIPGEVLKERGCVAAYLESGIKKWESFILLDNQEK